MRLEQVNDAVAEIKSTAGDDERAHSLEDDLHRAVLQAIAEGAPNAVQLAKAALKSTEISFARWCA